MSDTKAPKAKTPSTKTLAASQPGAPARDDRIAEMIRVDHAGEYGAVRIYEGQLAVFRHLPHKKEMTAALERMAEDEVRHLDRFNRIVNEHDVRPTALSPVWHAAGFALGAATALMGEKAAMACTVAVEDVIDEHYAGQLDALEKMGPEQAELKRTVAEFRDEEIAHKEEALAAGAEDAPAYPLLSGAIRAACRLAIKLSEKA